MSDHHIDPRNNTIARLLGIFIIGALLLSLVSVFVPLSLFTSPSKDSFYQWSFPHSFSGQDNISPPPAGDPHSREFLMAATQLTTFALLLDLIFRNQDFILKLVAALIPVVVLLFALFSLSSFTTFADRPAARRRYLGELPQTLVRLLALCLIIFVVAVGVYAFWVDNKAEGSAALLAPPGPACKPKRNSAKTVVVLIHGWNGDDTSWRKFPELLCQDEAFLDSELLGARVCVTYAILLTWLLCNYEN